MTPRITVWVLMGLLCLAASASAMSSANYAINWNVIGGGGGGSISSSYMMQDTIGLLAGYSSSSSYRLSSGFWEMMTTSGDSTPPASITNVNNTTYATTYINWSWTDPTDSDFSHVLVYIDTVPKPNVPKGTRYYNATGLTANAEHTLSTRTVDTSGNVNTTWVNQTRRTAPSPDTIPPASITNVNNTTYATTYINWSWTDPTDSDFSHVLVYIDNTPKPNVPKGTRYYNETGLTANADHTISTRTVDTSGNVNTTWVNQTRRTAPSISTTLTVAVPNGGEIYYLGSTLTMGWTYTGSPGTTVNIEVLKGAGTLTTLTGIPIGSGGTGWYNVTIPGYTPLGSDYRIRVTSTSNPSCTDTSDGTFTISGPTITVRVPNGGETFYLGNTLPMNWTYTGNPGTMVNIEVLKGAATLKTLTGIPIGSGGTGWYNVTIPGSTPLGSDYRIKVTSTSNAAYTDTSNGPFTISAASSSSITVTMPDGGENWVQGSYQTIQWTYIGSPGTAVNIEVLKNATIVAVIPGISIGTGGSGSFGLTVPYSTPVAADYRVRVTSASNPAYTDTSNGPFMISPAIHVTSPDGGENFKTESTLPMSWTYSGGPGSTVNIDVLKGGAILKTLPGISIGMGGSGSYSVNIPASTPLGSDYKIRVSSTSYTACTDSSDGLFTISALG